MFIDSTSFGIFGDFISSVKSDEEVYEARYIFEGEDNSFTLGYGKTQIDRLTETSLGATVFPSANAQVKDSSGYLYSYWDFSSSLNATLGVSQEAFKNANFDLKETNPKFGLSWKPQADINIRLAYLSTLSRTLASDATIEPTMVVGFNQFYNDLVGTVAKQSAAALDYKINKSVSLGLEYIHRDLLVPFINIGAPDFVDWFENTTSFYTYWGVNDSVALSATLQRESLRRATELSDNGRFVDVVTYRLPIAVNFSFLNKWASRISFTYIEQKGNFIDVGSLAVNSDEDEFWIADAVLSYKLPKRTGAIEVGVKNLFDEKFQYQETDTSKPTVSPERLGFVRLNLIF